MSVLDPARGLGVAFSCLLALRPAASAQTPSASDTPDRAHVLGIARDVIKSARYATLATLDDRQQPQARIVDPLDPDEAMTVYFATNPLSRKVAEIRRDPRVTLLYFDSARPAYVTLIGRARAVDAASKRVHFKQEWSGFFSPEKPDTYSLYRVEVSRIEVVSPKDGLPGNPATWRPEIVEIR